MSMTPQDHGDIGKVGLIHDLSQSGFQELFTSVCDQ